MHQFHMHFSCMGDDSFLLVPNNNAWKKKKHYVRTTITGLFTHYSYHLS